MESYDGAAREARDDNGEDDDDFRTFWSESSGIKGVLNELRVNPSTFASENTQDLFICCREGNLSLLRYLVGVKGFDLNIRDKFDSTPLYYGCLCGHLEIVRFCLENGARCEEGTFDGERCFYGSLNKSIKDLLKEYKTLVSRDPLQHFMQQVFDNRAKYADVTFDVKGKLIPAHRSILAARSRYFRTNFQGKWKDRQVVKLPKMDPVLFVALLRYCYCERFEIPMALGPLALNLARQCELQELESQIVWQLEVESLAFIVVKGEISSLRLDLGLLLDNPLESDLEFEVENRVFEAHKVFFCWKSDFFSTMFSSHFRESLSSGPVKLQDISQEIFAVIKEYLYINQMPSLTIDLVDEVFVVADMLLLPGLRSEATNSIILNKMVTQHNVLDALRLSQHFSMTKLEQHCCEVIALNLEECTEMPEFTEFVLESIQSIKDRQETDSVPLIDDIRYEILRLYGRDKADNDPNSARSQAARLRIEKLSLLDHIIETLGVKKTPYRE